MYGAYLVPSVKKKSQGPEMVVQCILASTDPPKAQLPAAGSHVSIDQRRRAVVDASLEDCFVERLQRSAEVTLLPRQMLVRQFSHYTGYLMNRPFLLKTDWIVDFVEIVGVDLLHRSAVAIRFNAVRSCARRKTAF